MKKTKICIAIIAIFILAIAIIPIFYAAGDTIYVNPGNGTLNNAINQAKNGDTIILQGDGTYNGAKIVIDKDITIQGTNMSRNNVSHLFEINGAANVTFKNLTLNGGAMITTQQNHYILDVKSQTNLTLDNVVLAYATRTDSDGKFSADVKNIYLRAGSDGTKVNLKDSHINGVYDCIVVESSDNVITAEKTELGGSLALALRNGSNNKVYIKNNSRIAGRSSFVADSEEAISIVGQENLEIEISDSEIFGTAVSDRIGGLIPAHVISFDDEESTNVNIKVMGNSTIEDDDKVGDSNIINFGSVSTPESNVSVFFENSVNIIPNEIAEKYNTSDEYAIVGIKDYKGDWTIKPYAKNQAIPDKDVPSEVEGYRLEKITYNTEDLIDQDYIKSMEITENTDIISHYIKLLNINIDGTDETFYIDENQTLSDLKAIPNALEALNALKNTDDNKEFKNYVVSYTDDNGEEVTDIVLDTQDNYKFIKNSTISADYKNKVKVTLKINDEERLTKYIDEGQCLDDLSPEDKNEFEEAVNSNVKRLKGYVEIVEGEEVEVSSKQSITKDIIIIPKYEVDIKIGEDILTIDEGATLESLSPEDAQKLNAHKEADKKDFKNFVKVIDNVEGEVIEETTPITEHIEIIAKYTVKVTISGNEYVLDEGKNIQNLIDEQLDANIALADFQNVEGKTLNGYVDEMGNKLTIYDQLNKHTTINPVYIVKVTIGEEEFTLNENDTLQDIASEDLERFNALKTERFSRFVDEEGNTVEENKPFSENTTLYIKNNVKVTISGQDYNLEEGKRLEEIDYSAIEVLNSLKNVENKNFKEFKNAEGVVITEQTVIDKDTILTPYYTVTVTVNGEEFTLNENESLSNLSEEDTQKLNELKKNGDKTFSRFVNDEGSTILDTEPFTENTNLTVKYNIVITINGTGYSLEEGLTLNNLTQEAKDVLTQMKTERFLRFVNSNNVTVEMDDPINESTTISAKYYVKITIGEEEFKLESGLTLNDLSQEDKERLETLKNNHEVWKHYVGLRKVGEEDCIDDNTTFNEDTNLEVVLTELVGDVNKDGKINAEDAAYILDRYKENDASDEDIARGDLNGDQQLNAEDASNILNIFKQSQE